MPNTGKGYSCEGRILKTLDKNQTMDTKLINPVLTAEQIEDIKKREAAAQQYLSDNGFIVDAVVQKVNVGEGMFVDKVIPYLQDTIHSRKVSVTPFGENEAPKKTP